MTTPTTPPTPSTPAPTIDLPGFLAKVDKALSSRVRSVNKRVGDVVLRKGDVGLDRVDNTSDAAKPISDATAAALEAKADRTELTALIRLLEDHYLRRDESLHGIDAPTTRDHLNLSPAATMLPEEIIAPLHPILRRIEARLDALEQGANQP